MGDAFGMQTKLAVPGQNLNASQGNAFWQQLTDGGSGLNVQDMFGRAQTEMGRSPASLYGEFAQAQPAMLAGAQSVANAAMSPFGTSARTLAAQQSENARRSIEARLASSGLGNVSSGAALRAITQGATEPLTQAETQIAQQYGNAFQNAYSPAAQASYANLLNRGAQYGGLAQTLFGGLAQQAAPEWTAPAYTQQEGWGSQLLGGLVGGAGSALSGYLGTNAGATWLTKLFGG